MTTFAGVHHNRLACCRVHPVQFIGPGVIDTSFAVLRKGTNLPCLRRINILFRLISPEVIDPALAGNEPFTVGQYLGIYTGVPAGIFQDLPELLNLEEVDPFTRRPDDKRTCFFLWIKPTTASSGMPGTW